jgi:hypothetical protein
MKKLLRSLKPLALACALAAALASSPGRVGATNDAPALQLHNAQPAHEPHPLDPLDREVQKRFHNVIGFGMARIAIERKFEPETEEEREAVGELKRAGYRVGLYLAGRAILQPVPEQYRRAKTGFGTGFTGQGFSGPIFLSSSDIKSVPNAAALWDETRRALVAFAGGSERYGFESLGWKAEARPVRAEESCLHCHRADNETTYGVTKDGVAFVNVEPKGQALKVGDPLGVLLYLYKKSP